MTRSFNQALLRRIRNFASNWYEQFGDQRKLENSTRTRFNMIHGTTLASPTRWTWVWVNSRSCWWTGRPGMLRFMGLQRVGHDWATELSWTEHESVTWNNECSTCYSFGPHDKINDSINNPDSCPGYFYLPWFGFILLLCIVLLIS